VSCRAASIRPNSFPEWALCGGFRAGSSFLSFGPGIEESLQLPAEFVPDAEQAIQLVVDDLQYLNVNQRGYLVAAFIRDEARVHWRFVTTAKYAEHLLDASPSKP
jgi:hypothetical protein